MSTDIVINGVSVNDLKEKKAAIQKGASEFISNAISEVQSLVKESLVNAESSEEAEVVAAKALSILESANVVAGASGVGFYLPFYEEYGNHDEEDILTHVLDNSENQFASDYRGGESLKKLYCLLGDMEEESRNWHSSTC